MTRIRSKHELMLPESPNGALVHALKVAGQEWLPVSTLAAALSMPRDGAHEALERLEKLGYHVERHPQLGVRLASAADLLTAEEIAHGLTTKMVGLHVTVLPETSSTNDEAAARAKAGCPDGAVVFAEKQTRGRGRLGRTWASPYAKGLWFSVVLYVDLPEAGASLLTLVGAVAAAETIRAELAIPALIRWPNDIVVRSKKLGGVLVESRSRGGRGRAYILGIGINVNYAADEMPRQIQKHATSLLIECGKPVDRIALARAMLERLDQWCLRVGSGETAGIAEAWRRLSSTLGRRVTVEQGGRQYRGMAIDLDPAGALILRRRKGPVRRFRAHEVTRVVEEPDRMA